MKHDPLNDALSVINNAERSGKLKCEVSPASKLIGRVLKVMQENGYIESFEYVENNSGGIFNITLMGNINKCQVIKPRWTLKRNEIEDYESRYLPAQNFGVLIITTNKGVLSNTDAKVQGVGGKLLAYIY